MHDNLEFEISHNTLQIPSLLVDVETGAQNRFGQKKLLKTLLPSHLETLISGEMTHKGPQVLPDEKPRIYNARDKYH